MKTGGTMNFLKKAGAILMLVAVFASSCNKYADDFKQLNTKLDALAVSVGGVTTLSADIIALKTQVTALQAAISAQPNPTAAIAALTTNLAAITTKVDAITTTLNAVATAGTATKAVVDGLKTDLTALATKVAGDDAAMTLQLNTLTAGQGTLTDAQAAMKAQLVTALANNVTLAASIATLQTSLDGLAQTGSGTDAATALTIQGLQLMLNAQKLQLDQLLLNTVKTLSSVTIPAGAQIGVELASTVVASVGTATGTTYEWATSTTGTATSTWTVIAAASTTSGKYIPVATDLGLFIRVKATGTGVYTGTVTSNVTTAVTAQSVLTSVTLVGGATAAVGVELTTTLAPVGATVTYLWESAATATGAYTTIAAASTTTGKYKPVQTDATRFIRVTATGKLGYTGTFTSGSTSAVASAGVTTPAFGAVAGNNFVTVTLTDGTFKAAPIVAADFTFLGSDAGKFTAAGVIYTRVSASVVTIQLGGTTTFTPGVLSTITVLSATQATQATLVTGEASTALSVTMVNTAIAGIVAPVAGATPVTTYTADASYTAVVTWTPAVATTFLGSTVYTVNIAITPAAGYTLSGVGPNTFTVNTLAAVNTINSGAVTKAFGATNAAPIAVAAIPGVTPPVTGATPVASIVAPTYTATVTWTGAMAPGGVFAASTAYTAAITIMPNAGYTVNGVAATFFTVAGATGTTNAANSGVVTGALFPATGL